MAPDLGKRCDFHNEWTFWDGFQTPSRSRKPLRHRGHSRSTAHASAQKSPETRALTALPQVHEKEGVGFRSAPT